MGQLQALLEVGIVPDLLVGTSVGAMNAAFIAGDPTPEGARRLAAIWRRTRRDDILPGGWGRLGALSRKALYPDDGIRRLVERNLPYRRFEEARVPLRIVATSLESGAKRVLSEGPVADAIVASTSIPGVYPPVVIGGERLIDGGIVDNVPVRTAVEAGADEVYVLAATSECPPAQRLDHLHDILLFSAGLLLRPAIDVLAACYQESARVTVPPASCPFPVGPFDFSRTDDLITEARRQTREFLVAEAPAA